MITLLIPTLNRSDFVLRYLIFLKKTSFRGVVCIGDSSNLEHFNRTKEGMKNLDFPFTVKHLAYPNLKLAPCIQEMVPQIDTPYCMYICDDDLIIPETLNLAAAFLKDNLDYSAVTGLGMYYNVKGDGVYGEFNTITKMPLRGFEEPTATQRLLNLFSNYCVVAYSLSRTDQFCKRWIQDDRLVDVGIKAELLPGCLSVVQGKVKQLDKIFVMRQVHEGRYTYDFFDSLIAESWLPSCAVFEKVLVSYLKKQDNISEEEAKKIFQKAFSTYVLRCLSLVWKNKYKSNIRKDLIKKWLGKWPLLYRVVFKIKQFIFSLNPMSLSSLSKITSPYHKAFMSVYQCVTQKM